MDRVRNPLAPVCALVLATAGSAVAQAPVEEGAVEIAARYEVWSNETFATASGVDLRLDVYVPRRQETPNPTVVHFHGGGWVEGRRQDDFLWLLPLLARGFTVVSADYRLANVAKAPAAVEDARCALKYVVRNADRFHVDLDKVVVSGQSAGAHLALMAGLLRTEDGFDVSCPTDQETRWSSAVEPPLKVAAVVNWFGIADVTDVSLGANARHWALEWLGTGSDRKSIAQAVSPVARVRAGGPAVITVHGDRDTVVPYQQSLALHETLQSAGATHQLVEVSGGHGEFRPARLKQAWAAVFEFLGARGLLPAARGEPRDPDARATPRRRQG